MRKSATDVMEELIAAAVLDGLGALKAASRGVPNNLLRDIGAIHANTTFADLPAELKAAVQASVRSAFTRLMREGYAVMPADEAPRRAPPPRTEHPRHPRGPARLHRKGGGAGRGPNKGGAPGRGPRPKGK